MLQNREPDREGTLAYDGTKWIAENRLFILGAGFSAEAGVPLTGELLSRAMDLCRKECAWFVERMDDFARECFQIDGEPDYKSLDLAKYVTYLEYASLRELGGGDCWSELGSKPMLCLRYHLAKAIAAATPRVDDVPEMYLRFAELLRPQRDLVITFNWDCLLELALRKVGKPYSYAYKDGHIVVEKLHGSVNWRPKLPEGEGYRHTVPWSPVGFGEGRELYSSDALLDPRRWPEFNLGLDIQPMIVLPGFGKAHDVRAIAPLWYKKFEEWALTGDTYIIGKGLPEDDFFVRSWFLENLPYIERHREDLPRRVLIIDPGAGVRAQYEFALKNPLVEIIPERFSIAHVERIANRT
jgi:hypothetical protein